MLQQAVRIRTAVHRAARRALNRLTTPLLLTGPTPSAAAILGGVLLAIAIAQPWQDGGPSAAETSTERDTSLELHRETLGSALSRVHGEDLTASVVRLVIARLPTPTPTPTPTPMPTAVPTAVPVPIEQAPPASEPEYSPPPAPYQPPAPAPAVSGGCSASMSGLGLALFQRQNAERTSRGMAPLAPHSCATRVAQIRASDMASRGYFSHTSPEGQTAFSLLDSFGVSYGWAGENIARNSYPGNEAVTVALQDFMASPGHRDNILSPNFTHVGVSYVVTGGGVTYFAIVFLSLG
jgi:uncharacterized protein YkwD